MNSIEIIRDELTHLGHATNVVRFPNFSVNDGQAVVFLYEVDAGSHSGKSYRIGISFQETGYPEYAPHFIHIYNAPLFNNRTPHLIHDEDNGKWSAFSVPPSDFWDGLPVEHKNMKTYLNQHVRRFWAGA